MSNIKIRFSFIRFLRLLERGILLSIFFLSIFLSSFAYSKPDKKPIYYVYLAGPEVFLSEPIQAGKEKKALIKTLSQNWPFELVGLYPMDNEIPEFKPNVETGIRIYRSNLELMNQADFIAANMVRFRSPSMDVGTAFEMGYMAGQNKPVFTYYDAKPFYGKDEKIDIYQKRVAKYWGLSEKDKALDKNEIHIENFSMVDNLMMVGAYKNSGYEITESFKETILNIAKHIMNKNKKTSK